jgi:hypothetical protein
MSTSKNRVAAFRARLIALGFKRLDLYVHEDDVARVQAYIARLNKARGTKNG